MSNGTGTVDGVLVVATFTPIAFALLLETPLFDLLSEWDINGCYARWAGCCARWAGKG